MNENTSKMFGDKPLLPHQQGLLDHFFEEPASRGHVVRWDTGLGVSFATAHLIKNLLAVKPTSRVLVLSRKDLAIQTKYLLASIGVGAELVDRFRYREMQDATSSGTVVWREGAVFILGMDFAKQEDIASNLCSVPWTLLVVPEAHQLRGQRECVVRELVASSPQVRVLLLTMPGVDDLPKFGIGPWTESTVRQADVVDAAGRRIFDLTPPVVRSIEFQPDASEQRLMNTVTEVVQLLATANGTTGPLVSIFENSIQSSLPALEEVVRRLRNHLAHGNFDGFKSVEEQDEETDADDVPPLPPVNNRKLLEALDKCLAELDSLTADSKLKALTQLLMHAKTNGTLPRSMCILTKYRATLFYIQTALEELGFAAYILHGTLPFDERSHAVHGFQEHGGILLATTALMVEGFSMPQVDSLVMYDLPRSQLMLQQILGRFQRFGRTVPLTIDVINGGEAMEVLGQILSANAGDRQRGNSPMANG